MSEHFDAVVVGMGPGGEVVAGALLHAKKNVAVIERELIGGECAYWACIPSKALLRAPEAATGADRAAGVDGAQLDWAAASDFRDYMIRHLDDSKQAAGYEDHGATVIRGVARLTGPGELRVGDRTITADDIILATGTEPVIPDIEGLADVPCWTNREATTFTHVPGSVVVIGGSAVAVELSQLLRQFGAAVTMLVRGDRLLSREDPRPAELTRGYLEEIGIIVRTGVQATRARRDGTGDDGITVLTLDDGSEVRCDVVVLGTGRRPRTHDLGVEAAGGTLGKHSEVVVDDHLRAGDGLWAVGDVTGVMPFTHVATYQGRVVGANLTGGSRTARYEGIPRVVFTDPELATVGLTVAQARTQGIDVAQSEVNLAEEIARPSTYEKEPRGHLGVLADRDRRVLVGAWAVGPQASEWIHTVTLAIREGITIERLLDQVAQFPTYNEGWLKAIEDLEL